MSKKVTKLENGSDEIEQISEKSAKNLRYIKFEGDNNALFWRFQADVLNPNAEIIVPETHTVIYVKDGMFMDELHGGRYPIFEQKKKLFGLVTQKVGAVSVDLVFISKTARLRVYWGTPDPFSFRDELTDLLIHIRAYGEFEVRVSNPRKFYAELVGSDKNFTISDLQNRLLGRLVSEAEPVVYKTIKENHISFDEISMYKLEIAASIKESLSKIFAEDYGLEICSFVVGNISPLNEEIDMLEQRRHSINKKREDKKDAKEIAAELERLSDKAFERNKILRQLESQDRDKYFEVLKILGWPTDGGQPKATAKQAKKAVAKGEKKICPICKAKYVGDIQFCPRDGGKLEKYATTTCPNCHKELPADVTFCPYCGHKVQ